jgi:hypothetical protein
MRAMIDLRSGNGGTCTVMAISRPSRRCPSQGFPTAPLAMPERQRVALVDLLQRYGRHHATGVVTIPEDCIRATVHDTARTPTRGHLREAFVVAVEPIGSERTDGASPTDPSCALARQPGA